MRGTRATIAGIVCHQVNHATTTRSRASRWAGPCITYQSRTGGYLIDLLNKAGAGLPGLSHHRDGLLGAQKHPLGIHIQDKVPRLFGSVFDTGLDATGASATDARIVHQDVQLTVPVNRCLHG